MLQMIENDQYYVVDFDTMPELPVQGSTVREMLYAQALTRAIVDGVITMPGKYAIHVTVGDDMKIDYKIYAITEK